MRKMHFKLHLVLFILISASARASRDKRSVNKNRRLPEPESTMVQPNLEPEIPEHCRNESICEDVPNYPHEYIDHLIQQNLTVKNTLLFMTGGLGEPRGCKNSKDPMNDEVDELCPSIIRYMQAKAGRDTSGRWYFLVGELSLCVELCLHPDNPCKRIGITVITGYKATCKQKTIKKTMAALDDNGAITPLYLPINSSCCCHVTQDDSSLLQI